MSTRATLRITVAASICLAAPARAADDVLARQGAALFAAHCAACHGANATGDGPVAAALRTPPADLTRIAERRKGVFPDAEIARFIDGRFDVPAHGTREMPIWGRQLGESIGGGTEPDEVARGRILAIVEYLKTIQRR